MRSEAEELRDQLFDCEALNQDGKNNDYVGYRQNYIPVRAWGEGKRESDGDAAP